MSFTTTREYPRHILQTLDLSSHSATSTRLSSLPKKQERFKNVWDTSIHTFSGAFPRRYNSKHPPSVHHSLPDLSKGPLDLHKYDPETAKPKTGQEAQYNMISSSKGPQDSDKVPCMVAKRYVPKGGDGKGNGITIVSSHGLGACKELLEPLLARMVAKIHPHQVVIDEIWSFDQVGCGDTGLINSRGLGISDEKDIARDLLSFVALHLPRSSSPASSPPPSQLPLIEPSFTSNNQSRKRLFSLGHSLGGQSELLLCAHAPGLFEGVVTMDPAVIPPGPILKFFEEIPIERYTIELKDGFTEEKEARAYLDEAERTKSWEPELKDIFLEHCFTKTDGKFALNCPDKLEKLCYHDHESPTHLYDRLTDIKTPLLWLSPPRPFAIPIKHLVKLFNAQFPNDKLEVLEKTTHSLCWEKPLLCADLSADWILKTSKAPSSRL